ncbi:MAG: DUF4153 domain-containing protein, partial [Burkholderiaceae bacterium]|nr:DUF4153 domain-containing protein [Burkholderiaceae bacterium]
FQSAWRIALNGLLATVLGGCVTTLLYLGAQLFATIGITFFEKLFDEPVFWRVLLPITFATTLIGVQRKLQLSSVLQRSWLTLNGWMLPLASALAVTFVFALVAQLAFGLRAGTLSAAVLIGFTAVWIKLVNATWQDGSDTAPFGPRLRQVLRWSLCFMLPLAALALYNVLVRVDQYGWTVSRTWAALAATLVVIYSVGYLLAALRPARFQACLAGTNYAAVFFAIATLTAFNTPVLDPRRVAADDQTARLLDGRLALTKFDFNLMTYRTDQYGHARLQQLADGAGAERDPQIAVFAKRALEGKYLSDPSVAATARPMPEFLVYPAGRTVPREWWISVSAGHLSEEKTCPSGSPQGVEPCAVIFADLSGTGREDIVLYVPRRAEPKGHYRGETFTLFLNHPSGWLMDRALSRKGEVEKVPGKTESAPAAGAEKPSITQEIARGAVRTAPRLDLDLVIGGLRVGR